MSNLVLRQFTVMLCVLALFGFGCKKEAAAPAPDARVPQVDAQAEPDSRVSDAPTPDVGLQIPEGWKVYENQDRGVKIAYPGGWYTQERSGEQAGSSDYLAVDFNDEPVFHTETEPYYLEAMLDVRPGTMEEALQIPQEVVLVSQTELQANGLTIYKQVLQDEFGGGPLTTVSYIAHVKGLIYDLSGFMDSPELAQMAQTLTVSGGE